MVYNLNIVHIEEDKHFIISVYKDIGLFFTRHELKSL
jgi:hypothetical protein